MPNKTDIDASAKDLTGVDCSRFLPKPPAASLQELLAQFDPGTADAVQSQPLLAEAAEGTMGAAPYNELS